MMPIKSLDHGNFFHFILIDYGNPYIIKNSCLDSV